MRMMSLITRILLIVFLISAVVVMFHKAPQCFNRLNNYLNEVRHPAPAKNNSKYGGTLTWGTINSPTIINPVLTSHSVSTALLDLIFDSLVRIDQHGVIRPGLAKSWEVSNDGLIYTFHLQEHVYFHDGIECTSQDVMFTFESFMDPLNQSPWLDHMQAIKQMKVLDLYTFQIELNRPTSDFLLILTQHQIMPKHLYEGKDLFTISYNEKPIGTGPFRFESWDHDNNEIRLIANDQYFEGRPFLDAIVIKSYKDNAALWAAFMRGEVDFVKFLNQKDYEVLSKDPTFKAYQFPTGLYFAIIYNLSDPVLNNSELRHALSLAVDRKALMNAVGIDGIESNGPFYPQSPWFNKKIEPVVYDPLQAMKILNQLGWKDKNKEGILKKNNKALVLTMLVDRNRWFYYQIALTLRQQLSEIGVGLRVAFYDNENQLTKDYLAQVKPQMWLRMFGAGNVDPADMVYSWYSSSSEYGRIWAYKNKTIDQLFEHGRITKDIQERVKDYQKVNALIDEDQPACFLFFSVLYNAVSSKVGNTEGFFNDYMPGYLMKQWFMTNGKEGEHGNHQSRQR